MSQSKRLDFSDSDEWFEAELCQTLVFPGERVTQGEESSEKEVEVEGWTVDGEPIILGKCQSSNLSSIEDIAIEGVSLQFLESILEDPRFSPDMTTAEVVETIIVPDTKECRTSFSRWVMAHTISNRQARKGRQLDVRALAGKANVFVSHSWSDSFQTLLLSLKASVGAKHGSSNTWGDYRKANFFWLDFVVLNQHNQGAVPTSEWCHEFQAVVRRIGKTVTIVNSLQELGSLKRTWCLFELFATIENNVPLELVFANEVLEQGEKTQQQVCDLNADHWDSVDILYSNATIPLDKTMILGTISKAFGVRQFNTIVRQFLRGWHLVSLQDPIANHALVMALLDKGVHPDLYSGKGKTALHQVCSSKDNQEVKWNLMEACLRSGFDPTHRTLPPSPRRAKSFKGRTCMDLVRKAKDKRGEEILSEFFPVKSRLGSVLSTSSQPESLSDAAETERDDDDNEDNEEEGECSYKIDNKKKQGFSSLVHGYLEDVESSKQTKKCKRCCAVQ